MNVLVADTACDWVPDALNKNIDLGYNGDTLPATVRGNPLRLRKMISNLLDNALRYTQPHGVVTAKTISNPPTLIIEDNGDGIPPEQQHVFERFYRILGSHSDGNGLGLSIMQEIANAHQAEIRLSSNPAGKDTIIRIEFPACSI